MVTAQSLPKLRRPLPLAICCSSGCKSHYTSTHSQPRVETIFIPQRTISSTPNHRTCLCIQSDTRSGFSVYILADHTLNTFIFIQVGHQLTRKLNSRGIFSNEIWESCFWPIRI